MFTRKLRSVMALHGDNDKVLADVLKTSRVTISKKMLQKTPFTLDEVKIISDRYSLDPQQVWDIFFDNKVYTNETLSA